MRLEYLGRNMDFAHISKLHALVRLFPDRRRGGLASIDRRDCPQFYNQDNKGRARGRATQKPRLGKNAAAQKD